MRSRNEFITIHRFLLFAFFIWLVTAQKIFSQVMPPEGSQLNYILVPFSVPPKENNSGYTLKVAEGHFSKQMLFDKNVIISIADTTNAILAELPSFGASYSWQITYDDGSLSPLYHFATTWSPIIDTTKYRLRILKNDYADSSILFFLDYSRSLYNMQGRKVWYLPDLPPYVDSSSRIRDLKMTPFGTITFLTDTGAYEIDYDANILWKAPDTAQKGLYHHHEFTRLHNGNYMTLGMESIYKKIPSDSATLAANADAIKKDDAYYKLMTFSTITEYNRNGILLWKWSSSDLFDGEGLEKLRLQNGLFLPLIRANGFYMNEKDNVIYTGFRDISLIAKISYPGGKILNTYGEGYSNTPSKLFAGQHAYSLNANGDLLLYNNNSVTRDDGETSSILILREPQGGTGMLKKFWEYKCDIDDEAPHTGHREGNVIEMPGGDMLANMGTSQRIFIAGIDKTLKFNAISEKWDYEQKKWVPFPQYRVGLADRYKLLKMR